VQASALEAELFGGAGDLLQRLDGHAAPQADAEASGGQGSISSYIRDVSAADGVAGQVQVQVDAAQQQRHDDAAAAQQSSAGKRRKPVWHDEDDSFLRVDLAAVPQLRKLRKSSGENRVDGAAPPHQLLYLVNITCVTVL
jgi:hypothetical protein